MPVTYDKQWIEVPRCRRTDEEAIEWLQHDQVREYATRPHFKGIQHDAGLTVVVTSALFHYRMQLDHYRHRYSHTYWEKVSPTDTHMPIARALAEVIGMWPGTPLCNHWSDVLSLLHEALDVEWTRKRVEVRNTGKKSKKSA